MIYIVGESLLLGTGSADVSIDMESLQREQGQMQLLQEQVTSMQPYLIDIGSKRL